MKKKKLLLPWLLGSIAWTSGVTFAQTIHSIPQPPLPLQNAAASPRAAGLGSAFTAVEGDLGGLYGDPAGLGALREAETSFSFRSLTGGAHQEFLSTNFPLAGIGVLALGLDHLTFGTLPGYDTSGNPTGPLDPFRTSFTLGLGMLLDPSFSVGFSTRYSYQFLAPGDDLVSPSVTGGFQWEPVASLRLGAFYSSYDAQSTLAAGLFKIGSSWSAQPLDPLALMFTLDLSLPSSGLSQIQTGIEGTLWSSLALRIGYQQDLEDDGIAGLKGLTAGLGYRFDDLDLDYAFTLIGTLGASHNVGLTYLWPQPEPPSDPEPVPTAMAALNTPTPVPTQVAVVTTPTQPMPTNSPTPSWTPGPTGTATPLPPVNFKPAPEEATEKDIVVKKVRFKLPDVDQAQPLATPSPQLQQQITALSDKVQKDPKDAAAWINLGNLYWANGQPDFTAQCFEEALTIWPDNTTLTGWLHEYRAKKHPGE